MLTDRQQRFYSRISSLSLNSSSATSAEKEIFWETEIYLDKGADFKSAINSMNIVLESFDKDFGLSPEAKKLYEDLINTYGEPEIDNAKHKQSLKKIGGMQIQT